MNILLENLLRTEDGANITAEHIRALAEWDPAAEPSVEIQFTPGRVLMQDFTGVPCVVDLATMREAVQELGGDPSRVPWPRRLVIDHSVIADVGRPDAFGATWRSTSATGAVPVLRWGETFDEPGGPPGTGIVPRSTSSTWPRW